MKIGIAYDTLEMYTENETKDIHFDFASELQVNSIKKGLESMNYEVELIGNKDKITQRIKKGQCNFDIIYNTVEGINSRNREGLVPAILEANNIPYVGTDAFGLSLSLNKVYTKILAQHFGIQTPDYCVFENSNNEKKDFSQLAKLSLPIIVKPNFEGNSSGVQLCHSYDETECIVSNLLNQYKTSILCEEFIYGTEITIPIIGNCPDTALWAITTLDIQRDGDFWFDKETKLFGDYQDEILELPSSLETQFKEISFKLFNIIGCSDFARFDFRLSANQQIYFIEANPLPCLSQGGDFDVAGQHYGLSYAQTLQLIINTACDRLSIPKT